MLNARYSSGYKLNKNPNIYDFKYRISSDEYSLRYLKEIAKSITLRNNNDEANSIIEEKSRNDIERIKSNDFSTDYIDKISKKVLKQNRVSFKENLIEPEEKKSKIFFKN